MSKQKNNKQYTGTGKLVFNTFVYFIIAISVLAFIFGGYTINRILAESPPVEVDKINSYEPTRVYDNKGNMIATVGGEVRKNVTYDQIPQTVIDAFLAVEDSRFESHNGFDIPRFIKSFLVNIRAGGIEQGGSTITMQLVDNTYFNTESSEQTLIQRLKQKISEISMGMDLETKIGKKEIITAYLNKINFGDRIRGIGKAAEYYFGKDISQINLSEAAFLAGVINAPNTYNPYSGKVKNDNGVTDHLKLATERRNTSLYLMKLHGYISEEEYNLALNTKLEFQLSGTTFENDDSYLSYVDVVAKEVEELTGKNPHTVSMSIYTAMDKETQDVSNRISKGELVKLTGESNLQIGAAVIDNVNHELIAINAGLGKYEGNDRINFATGVKNQIGSTSKPLVDYGPAFDYLGYSTSHTFDVSPIKYRGTNFSVTNVGPNSGKYQLDYVLGHSLNTPALDTFYKVWDKIGENGYNQLMKNLGLDVPTVTDQFSIGAGDFRLTPVELAGAYSAFANGGVYHKPSTIRKIVIHSTGETITRKTVSSRAYSPQATYLMNTLLQKNVSGGWGNGLGSFANLGFPVYGKTGTTDWGTYGAQYGIPNGSSRDIWISAFSGNTTVATWVGYDYRKLDSNAYFTWPEVLLQMPQNISRLLLSTATKQRENVELKRPEGITDITHIKDTYPYVRVESSGENITKGLIATKFLENTKEYKPQQSLPSNSEFKVTSSNNSKQLNFSFASVVSEDEVLGKSSYVVTIKKSNGETVFEQSYTSPNGSIDVSKFESGEYTITGKITFDKVDPKIEERSYTYKHTPATPSSEETQTNNEP